MGKTEESHKAFLRSSARLCAESFQKNSEEEGGEASLGQAREKSGKIALCFPSLVTLRLKKKLDSDPPLHKEGWGASRSLLSVRGPG